MSHFCIKKAHFYLIHFAKVPILLLFFCIALTHMLAAKRAVCVKAAVIFVLGLSSASIAQCQKKHFPIYIHFHPRRGFLTNAAFALHGWIEGQVDSVTVVLAGQTMSYSAEISMQYSQQSYPVAVSLYDWHQIVHLHLKFFKIFFYK